MVDWYSHSCHIKGASTTNHINALLFSCCLLQHYGSPKHAAFACTAQVAEVYQSSGIAPF